MTERLRRAARGLVLPVLCLAAWEAASRSHLVDPRILPPLESVGATAATSLLHGTLAFDLLVSLARDMAGFVGGTIVGAALGILLGVSGIAERLVLPTFNGLRQIAILAWIPLISLWFGFGDTAKVMFILLSAFVPVTLNTYQGIRSTPADLREVATALRFTWLQRVTRLFVPAALPSMVTGMHLALIYSWVAAIGSEYFMTVGPGIGGLIISGRERFDMDLVLLGMLLLGIVGFAINRTASVLETRLLRWRP